MLYMHGNFRVHTHTHLMTTNYMCVIIMYIDYVYHCMYMCITHVYMHVLYMCCTCACMYW